MPEPTTTEEAESPEATRLMAILSTAITYAIDATPGAFRPIDTPPDLAPHVVPGQTMRGSLDAKGAIQDLLYAAATIALATGVPRREGFTSLTHFLGHVMHELDADGCRAGLAEATFRGREAIIARMPPEIRAVAAGLTQYPIVRRPEDDHPRAGTVTVEDMVEAVGKIIGAGPGEGGAT
jgi:hypothetical protein